MRTFFFEKIKTNYLIIQISMLFSIYIMSPQHRNCLFRSYSSIKFPTKECLIGLQNFLKERQKRVISGDIKANVNSLSHMSF